MLALADERAKWRSEEERSAVGQVKARQEGMGQARAAARRASPAHGGHAACALCVGQARRTGTGAARGGRPGERAGPALRAGPKARLRPI